MRPDLLRVFIIGCISFLGIAGCSVISSHNTNFLTGGNYPRQGAGAYHLPKHILVATVTSSSNGSYNLTLIRKAIADARYPMNVGLNLSPTSNDDIDIKYSDGLISQIIASADDKTSDIILNLTKAIYSNVPRNAKLNTGTETRKILQVSFDPFNNLELNDANQKLTRVGFCIAFAVDAHHPFPQGCENRYKTANDHALNTAEITDNGLLHETSDLKQVKEGVFFRQPIEHKVRIYEYNAPQRSCRQRWCTINDSYIAFANSGPLLAVNINRTIFVKHETTIKFGSDGVPSQVHIVKPSEGLAASLLPLNITKAIISAPLDALTTSTTTIAAQKANIDAKTQLLESQTTYINNLNVLVANGQEVPAGHDIGAVLGTTPVRTVNLVGDARSGNARAANLDSGASSKTKFYQYCSDVGLDQGGCENEWRRLNPR